MADREYLTQLGTPAVDKAFNGLRTITRLYSVNGQGTQQAQIESKVFLAYGTADAEFTTALLVKRGMEQVAATPSAWVLRLTEVYQELTAGSKVSVGEDQHFKLEDGRYGFVRRYVALASEAEGLAAAIGDVVSSQACNDVKINKQGVGAEIVETYISAGKLAESNSRSNNDKLLQRTLVYFNEVPPTPSGYVLVDDDVKGPLGVETYTYRFAKGVGEISRDIDRSQNGTTVDGSVGVTRLNITYLTAPGAAEPTWSGVSGYVQVKLTNDERDGHEVWQAVYAKGAGLVSESIDYGPAGLRRVTDISLGTKVTPTGIVIRDDYREAEGFRVFTVTSMQTAAGGADPTAITVAAERYVSFTYPGRAKAFTETYDGKLMLAAFLSPPVTTQVKATVTISYVTTATLGTISDFWNPSDWATIKRQWVGSYGKQTSDIRALPGYRSVSSTPVTHTGTGTDSSIEGSVIYNGTTARITITGGPADPGGNTYTLDAEIDPDPVFVKTDGTKYFRKTVITAAIPAQAALPV